MICPYCNRQMQFGTLITPYAWSRLPYWKSPDEQVEIFPVAGNEQKNTKIFMIKKSGFHLPDAKETECFGCMNCRIVLIDCNYPMKGAT